MFSDSYVPRTGAPLQEPYIGGQHPNSEAIFPKMSGCMSPSPCGGGGIGRALSPIPGGCAPVPMGDFAGGNLPCSCGPCGGGALVGTSFLNLFGDSELSLQEIADRAHQFQQKIDENAEQEKATLRSLAEQKHLEIERHSLELSRHAASSIEAYKTAQLQTAERQKAFQQAVVRQQAEQAKRLIDQQAIQAIHAIEARERHMELQRSQQELYQRDCVPTFFGAPLPPQATPGVSYSAQGVPLPIGVGARTPPLASVGPFGCGGGFSSHNMPMPPPLTDGKFADGGIGNGGCGGVGFGGGYRSSGCGVPFDAVSGGDNFGHRVGCHSQPLPQTGTLSTRSLSPLGDRGGGDRTCSGGPKLPSGTLSSRCLSPLGGFSSHPIHRADQGGGCGFGPGSGVPASRFRPHSPQTHHPSAGSVASSRRR
eukprot:TRINITY_DN56906_c0_g1_i1.p1 TRINITY_DN56906_c0_g1~~TRINITY_DN56906_c0_g1_i1.p1  ORF type:complete len:423 (-),score=66.82 TRINITY_DN56906_c0_g1_i1:109-1377(-)